MKWQRNISLTTATSPLLALSLFLPPPALGFRPDERREYQDVSARPAGYTAEVMIAAALIRAKRKRL